MKKLNPLVLLALMLLPAVSQAWWNPDWKQRTQILLNTTAGGVQTQQPLNGVTVPVRLHSGNFDFVGAKPDGSDLRVVAGDDKTPLKFWIERFDSLNELGVLWVQVPTLASGSDKNVFYVYAGGEKATALPPDNTVFDASTLAAFHFSEKDGIAADQSGAIKATSAVALEPNGLIGQSAHPNTTPIVFPASDKLKVAGGAFSIALWVKPEASAGTLFSQGPVKIALANGALTAQVGSTSVSGGNVAPAAWSQVILAVGAGKATLYVNGTQAGQGDLASAPEVSGEVRLAEGYQGLLDEVEISNSARSPEWVKVVYAAQSADARLIASKTETPDTESSESSGGGGYFGILFKSLTPDAIVVISILGVMFIIALMVMITKALYVNRTEGANRKFLRAFRGTADVLKLDTNGVPLTHFSDSSLYRLYEAGLKELIKRDVGKNPEPLSFASIDAVKAAIDADSVREGYRLNSQMVLLTIAISGGPFLGLLGTVIGVMITFAAIAAAGDVNVNAIAPGIAAALLATVAGLGVAIPSLFAYNYLASRIKTISSDMQIFIDEFVTRVAEAYGNR